MFARTLLIVSSSYRILTCSAICSWMFSIINASKTSSRISSSAGSGRLSRAAACCRSFMRVSNSLCRITPSSTRAIILSKSTRCAEAGMQENVVHRISDKPIENIFRLVSSL